MNEKDNVATTLRPLVQGQKALVKTISGELIVELQEAVPPNHKFAIHDVTSGEHILKFGEIIGIAAEDIHRGKHVHTQNLRSLHGKGSQQTSS
ncbi:MAG: UxaA family hydrolase [Candidatus Bathyarchaeia archaeon]